MTGDRWTTGLLYTGLLGGTAGSVWGNLQHAPAATGARVWAVIPPLAVLLLTEVAAAWTRGRGVRSRAAHWVILTGTALLLAAAAVLSFTALADLSVRFGFPAATAWLWPVILDGLLGLCAFGLMVNRSAPAAHREPEPVPAANRDEPAVVPVPEPQMPAEPRGREIAWSEPRFIEDRPVPAVVQDAEPVAPPGAVPVPAPQVDEPAREPVEALENHPVPEPVPEEGHGLVRETPEERAERLRGMRDRLTAEAEAIIATGRTTQPPQVVRGILHGLDTEVSRRANAAAAEVSPNVVRQIEALRAEVSGRLALVPDEGM